MTNSRAKGKGGELECKNILKKYFSRAKRGLQYQNVEAGDIEGTPYRIEVKRNKKVPGIELALEQCERDGKAVEDDRLVCAITRRDNKRWIISFFLEDWLEDVHG